MERVLDNKSETPLVGLGPANSLILILLVVTILRGLIYATVVPMWNAPDEPAHYQYAERMAERAYPALATDKLYGQKIFYEKNPTAYYRLAGAWMLPVSLVGGLTARAYALRLLSILLTAGVVYFTYRMAREVFPDDEMVYLSAPLIVAMLPMYTFTGMSINPDNLAVFLFTLFLWLSVRTLMKGLDIPVVCGMVLAVAAALLTKRTTFVSIIMLTALPFFFVFRARARSGVQRSVRLLAVALAVAGVFLILPILSAIGVTLARLEIFSYLQKATEVNQMFADGRMNAPLAMFVTTLWGNFGWADTPLAANQYLILQKVWWLPVVGYALIVGRIVRGERQLIDRMQLISLIWLAAAAAGVVMVVLLYQPVTGADVTAWLPQARYAWTVLGAVAVAFSVGVIKPFKGAPRLLVFLGLALAMFVFDLSVLFTTVLPRYYAEFGPAAALLRDPIETMSPSLFNQLRALGVSQAHIKETVLLRPAILSTGKVYYAFFAFYALAFATLLAAVYRRGQDRFGEDRPVT